MAFQRSLLAEDLGILAIASAQVRRQARTTQVARERTATCIREQAVIGMAAQEISAAQSNRLLDIANALDRLTEQNQTLQVQIQSLMSRLVIHAADPANTEEVRGVESDWQTPGHTGPMSPSPRRRAAPGPY